MLVPGSTNPLLLFPSAAAGGYQISRSLRFNSADSPYLSRTFATPTSNTVWTLSAWVKRSQLGAAAQTILSAGTSEINFQSDLIYFYAAGPSTAAQSTAVFRDPSAWYHLVVASNGTTVVGYINNSQVMSYTGTLPQFNSASTHTIGKFANSSVDYFNGYLADIHFIDGQALTPSSFTEVSATTGQLIPKAYTGSFGTNGFHLDFADNSAATAAALGKDTSGLGNNWTPNNLSIITGGPTSVASASGALPILNTTDTYGTTIGSGVRSDSNASSLVLAVAGSTSSALDLTDQIPSGRTQAAQSITNNGLTSTTSTSKLYSRSVTCTSGQDMQVSYNSSMALGSTFTVEAWVNPAEAGNEKTFLTYGINAADGYVLMIGTGGAVFRSNGENNLIYSASISGWNHIAFVANSSGTKRSIYLNGILVASDSTTPSVTGSYTTYIGSSSVNGASFRFTGQFQDVRIYKGLAKYTSNFNPPSSTQNATVAAGNDSLVDVPTNGPQTDTGVGGEVRGNYATLNPLDNGGLTISDGNLQSVRSIASWVGARATIAITSGKWYWEYTVTNRIAGQIGINTASGSLANYAGSSAGAYVFDTQDGTKWSNNSQLAYFGSASSNSQVHGIAFDADAGTITFYRNNTTPGVAYSSIPAGTYFPVVSQYNGESGVVNFGQRPFAYTAPSGYKALNTANLPAPVVTKPSTVMDVVLYTGTGSTLTPTSSLGFSPDLVWIKGRSGATDHALYDTVRGAQARLESNTTDAEVTTDGGVTAFNSNGFTLGTLAQVNTNTATYAAWCWDAGSSNVVNTQGSITSTVRANASAGFSVVTYTGTSANATVGHGLGVAPQFLIVKRRDNTNNWWVYHQSLGASQYINLETTGAAATAGIVWNSTNPTSTVFSIGTVTSNGNTVAYCFAPVAGYSSFGSYTGNGSADGPFVYTNVLPRWVMIKRTDSTSNWTIIDTAREGYNVDNDPLYPNLSDAEGTADLADILSNGFKLRTTDASVNASAGTYIYACFGANPFAYSRSR